MGKQQKELLLEQQKTIKDKFRLEKCVLLNLICLCLLDKLKGSDKGKVTITADDIIKFHKEHDNPLKSEPAPRALMAGLPATATFPGMDPGSQSQGYDHRMSCVTVKGKVPEY